MALTDFGTGRHNKNMQVHLYIIMNYELQPYIFATGHFSQPGPRTKPEISLRSDWKNIFPSFSQDLMSLSPYGGFLFYPYSNVSAASAQYLIPPTQSRQDFKACPNAHSSNLFSSPNISLFVTPAGESNRKYLNEELLALPKLEQKMSAGEARVESSLKESQTEKNTDLCDAATAAAPVSSCLWSAVTKHISKWDFKVIPVKFFILAMSHCGTKGLFISVNCRFVNK